MNYLKANVKSEPLICNWYMWTHLVSPLTSGCNILSRYLPIMESFIAAPQLHEQALKMPEMIGSPFIDLPKERVGEIKELCEKTKVKAKNLIELAEAYKNLDRTLQENAIGGSMENHYKLIPPPLNGMVELVYNSHNLPEIRLIEKLIYSNYYDPQHQQVHLSLVNQDYRPFLLNTPRFVEKGELIINKSLNDPAYDLLYKARYEPVNLDKLIDLLEVEDKMDEFVNLFTKDRPALIAGKSFEERGVRVRYFGHACLLLQTDKLAILIDPIISYSYPADLNRFTYEDLPDSIDYVLITHNHQDHIQFETLLQLRHKIKHIVVPQHNVGNILDPSLKLILNHLGFDNIITASEFDPIACIDGEIIPLPFLGEHGDLPILSKVAYFIRLKGKRFLFAADSNNLDIDLYNQIAREISAVDVAFVGMECVGAPLSWVYAPLLTNAIPRHFDQERRLSGSDSAKAIKLISSIKCQEVYVYAMGQEPWLSYIMGLNYESNSPQLTESDNFINLCKQSQIKASRLFGHWEMVYG